MNQTKILSIVFFVISIALAVYLWSSIFSSIDEAERIENMENKIINKLMMIREAQIAYQAVNGQYTSDWDKLTNFVDTGKFYITERREIVTSLDYGADSIYVEIDTLGTILVRDSVFTSTKYPLFDLATLSNIPGVADKQFAMWADKIDKSGVRVDVVEVRNVSPVNPARNENNESNSRKPLRFGSRTNITTAGNWE